MRGGSGPAVRWAPLAAAGLWAAQAACVVPIAGVGLQGQVAEIRRQVDQIESLQRRNLEAVRALEVSAPRATGADAAPAATTGAERDSAAPETMPPRAGAAGVPSEEAAYRVAYTMYHRGAFEAAERALRAFLRAHPESPRADDARYWIGEALFARGRYAGAMAAFREGIEALPAGEDAARALYKIGLCHLALGQKVQARATLASLLEQHPDSDVAALARERLAEF